MLEKQPKNSKMLWDKHHSWATVWYSLGQIQADVYFTKGMDCKRSQDNHYDIGEMAGSCRLQVFPCNNFGSSKVPRGLRTTGPPLQVRVVARYSNCLHWKLFAQKRSNHICEHIIFLRFIDVHGVMLRLLCAPPCGAVAYVTLAGAGGMPNVRLKNSWKRFDLS